jgi:hypothetical protein
MAMMKRMVVAVTMALSLVAMPVRAQVVKPAVEPLVKDDLFAGTEKFEKNAVKVTEVTMDPQSLGMVDGKEKDRARGMKLNVTREYRYDKPGMYNMADVDAYRSKLNTGDWYCSVRIRDLKEGKSTDVCQKRRSDDLVESAIITVEPLKLTFIHTIGAKGTRGGSYGAYTGGWYGQESLLNVQPGLQMEMAETIDMSRLQMQVDQALRTAPKLDNAELQRKVDDAMKSVAERRQRDGEAETDSGKPDAQKQPE